MRQAQDCCAERLSIGGGGVFQARERRLDSNRQPPHFVAANRAFIDSARLRRARRRDCRIDRVRIGALS
jgi:hypothetical protein